MKLALADFLYNTWTFFIVSFAFTVSISHDWKVTFLFYREEPKKKRSEEDRIYQTHPQDKERRERLFFTICYEFLFPFFTYWNLWYPFLFVSFLNLPILPIFPLFSTIQPASAFIRHKTKQKKTFKKTKKQENTKIMRLLSSFPVFCIHQHLHRDAQWSVWLERWDCLVFLLFIFFLASFKRQRNGPRRVVYLYRAFALLCIVLSCSQFFVFPILFFPCRRPFFYLFLRHTRKKKEEAK